jgi:hypothetical protein
MMITANSMVTWQHRLRQFTVCMQPNIDCNSQFATYKTVQMYIQNGADVHTKRCRCTYKMVQMYIQNGADVHTKWCRCTYKTTNELKDSTLYYMTN